MKTLLGIVLALMLGAGYAHAQSMQQQAYPMVGSAAPEGSHVFKTLNLDKIKVVWNSATSARYLMIFDGVAVPTNGAVTACSSSRATGCLAWCGYMPNSLQAPAEQWFDWGYFPMHNSFGTVAAVSTGAGCGTLTADGSNDFIYAQAE